MQFQLDKLGIGKARAGRYLGVGRDTVRRWCKTGAPDHVTRHLGMLISYQVALDAVRQA